MANATETRITELEDRVLVPEQVAHRVLFVIGAAGEMLSSVRRPHPEEDR